MFFLPLCSFDPAIRDFPKESGEKTACKMSFVNGGNPSNRPI
jgi:hypothetical protein